jgi:hypothetical protein
VPRVPITFEPSDLKHLQEIEEVNDLSTNELRSTKWIKPLKRRCPDQTHAYAIFSFLTADSTNRLIRDGLNICRTKVRPKKQKLELIQCMRCRLWEHFATECKEAREACGNCREEHCTSTCTNRNKLHCISCNESNHASWDRKCLVFLKRCAIYNEHNPENGMPYYPMELDWTLNTRPEQIPLEERFPKKYAVNSLHSTTNKHLGLALHPNVENHGTSDYLR